MLDHPFAIPKSFAGPPPPPPPIRDYVICARPLRSIQLGYLWNFWVKFIAGMCPIFVILTLHGLMHKSVTKFIIYSTHMYCWFLAKTVQAECDCTAFAIVYPKKKRRAQPGFEPGTSCTRSRNHTTRPLSRTCLTRQNFLTCFFILSFIILPVVRIFLIGHCVPALCC